MYEHNNRQVFARNLNHFMELCGKAQIDLIHELGINKSTISTWCNGINIPRIETIQILADYFGIMKSDLIEEKPTACQDDELSQIKKDFIEKVKRMDDEQVDKLDKIASLVVDKKGT